MEPTGYLAGFHSGGQGVLKLMGKSKVEGIGRDSNGWERNQLPRRQAYWHEPSRKPPSQMAKETLIPMSNPGWNGLGEQLGLDLGT